MTHRHPVERGVLLLGTVAVLLLLLLWTRSYFRMDALDLRVNFSAQPDGRFLWRHLKAWSSRGGLIVRWETHHYTGATPRPKPLLAWISAKPGEHYDHYDTWEPLRLFQAVVGARGGGAPDPANMEPGSAAGATVAYVGDWLYFPHYAAMIACALPPAAALHRRRRRRQRGRSGRCPECGYDLRASPQRCPECGHATDDASLAAGGS